MNDCRQIPGVIAGAIRVHGFFVAFGGVLLSALKVVSE
jgi:hypothetical protein